MPDKLRSGGSKSHRYEPDTNPTYQDMASHYGVAVLPARVRKPCDKAKVEGGVLIVERWILAALRHRQFFSLAELNAVIGKLLVKLNARPFRKLPGCRREHFEQLDRPALQPLPAEPYVYAEWKKARVHIDYHVAIEGIYYSVPYALIKKQVDIRITRNTIECFWLYPIIGGWAFTPRSVNRDAEQQARIDEQTARLTLYQYEACPFCVKVRRAMKRQGLNIETRDVKRSDTAREELLAGGGDLKVPCLRIAEDEQSVQWMYESRDIIGYLEKRFLANYPRHQQDNHHGK